MYSEGQDFFVMVNREIIIRSGDFYNNPMPKAMSFHEQVLIKQVVKSYLSYNSGNNDVRQKNQKILNHFYETFKSPF